MAQYVIEWATPAPGSESRWPVGVYAQDEQGVVPAAVPLPADAIALRTGLHPMIVRGWAGYAASVATSPRTGRDPLTGAALEASPTHPAFLALLAETGMEGGFAMSPPAEEAGAAAEVAGRVALRLAAEYTPLLQEEPRP